MAAYFKNSKAYKLQNRCIYSTRAPSQWPNFGVNRSKVKITVPHNVIHLKCAITQYWVVLSTSYTGADIRTTPPLSGCTKRLLWQRLPWQHRLPSNRCHEICSLWPHISKTIRSIHSKLGTCIEHELPVTWPNFGINRSKVKVTRAHKFIQLKCDITQYWVIVSSSYFSHLGANIWAHTQFGYKLLAMSTLVA